MFPERTGLRADRSHTGVPGNSTELLMSSLSVPSDFRPVNENLPPVCPLPALSPATLRKKSPSSARRLPPFSGQGTEKSPSRPGQSRLADWTGGRLGLVSHRGKNIRKICGEQ